MVQFDFCLIIPHLKSQIIGWFDKPSLLTIMSFPILEVFKIIDEDESMNYLYNDSMKESKVQDFFQINDQTKKLEFKQRRDARNPNLLNRLKRAVNNGQIIFKEFIDEDM